MKTHTLLRSFTLLAFAICTAAVLLTVSYHYVQKVRAQGYSWPPGCYSWTPCSAESQCTSASNFGTCVATYIGKDPTVGDANGNYYSPPAYPTCATSAYSTQTAYNNCGAAITPPTVTVTPAEGTIASLYTAPAGVPPSYPTVSYAAAATAGSAPYTYKWYAASSATGSVVGTASTVDQTYTTTGTKYVTVVVTTSTGKKTTVTRSVSVQTATANGTFYAEGLNTVSINMDASGPLYTASISANKTSIASGDPVILTYTISTPYCSGGSTPVTTYGGYGGVTVSTYSALYTADGGYGTIVWPSSLSPNNVTLTSSGCSGGRNTYTGTQTVNPTATTPWALNLWIFQSQADSGFCEGVGGGCWFSLHWYVAKAYTPAFVIGASPQPDLTAGGISPTSATVGAAVTLSSTVSNGGNASTGATFTDLFQSATNASGANTTDIGTYSSAALAASGSNTATKSYTFPSAGTYYVRACADKASSAGTGTITESNEANNCGAWTAITVSSGATAPGGSCSVSPASITTGGSATWTASATGGNGSYTYSWSGTDSLSGSSSSVSKTYSTAGTKTASVVVTSNGVSSTLTCSNSLAVSDPVAAECPDSDTGDVVVTGATTGSAYGKSPYTSDSNIAKAAVHAGLIALGETATIHKASVGTVASFTGSTKNGVTTLSYGSPWCAVTLSKVKPDLTAGGISPATASAGSAVTLSSTISNTGAGTTGASFTDLFQRATNSSGAGATDIGTYASAAIAGSGSNIATLSYTFPSAGTYYVRACADKASGTGTGTITESNEANNCGAWTLVTVSAATPPSIASCTPSPASAAPNQSVTWTVSTAGFSPAPTSYVWSATGGTPSSKSGAANTFTATFAAGGGYSPTVTASNSSQSVGPTSCTPVTISGPAATCGAGASATISADPTRVTAGTSATITYTATGIAAGTSCTLTGPNAPATTAVSDASCNISSGSFGTGAISTQSVYTITCSGATAQTAVVNVLPKFQEF